MKEELIDTAQIETGTLPEKEFPASQKFRICITAKAHDAVWRHARESVANAGSGVGDIVEVGGILLGNIYRDHEGPFLEVTAAIAGEHTKNQGTQVTFTPETWMQVNGVKDKRYPDSRIVGWYHTHPRFGIFLSDMDKFIHKHHFPQPWTTALVVDPVQESEGFFVWNEGEPSVSSEYWVGSERREHRRPIQRQEPEPPIKELEEEKGPSSPVSRASFALALVACFLGVLFLAGYFYMREVEHSDKEKMVMLALGQQRQELQTALVALEAMRQELEASRQESSETEERMREQMALVETRLLQTERNTAVLQAAVATHRKILLQTGAPQEIPTPGLPDLSAGSPAGQPGGMTGGTIQSQPADNKGKNQPSDTKPNNKPASARSKPDSKKAQTKSSSPDRAKPVLSTAPPSNGQPQQQNSAAPDKGNKPRAEDRKTSSPQEKKQ